jgi:hypothetical protein
MSPDEPIIRAQLDKAEKENTAFRALLERCLDEDYGVNCDTLWQDIKLALDARAELKKDAANG